MSVLLADIDATCAALGYNGEEKYQAEPDAVQGLKHLIWILRRDLDNHEYRRHLGRAKVLQTDLVPMLPHYIENEDYADVLIRLLVILTNPALLLYREGLPKDGPGRKIYLELVDILQGYKEAFTDDFTWAALAIKLQKVLEISWGLRHEEQGLLIERVLVLVRNVLHVPANPEAECRADNDASLHDRVIWALHRSGMLDLVLYILSSADENQYHLHALEIVCLMYREQTAASLADASLQRSAAEKHRDEQELIAVRRRERQRLTARPPPGRHSRFGGTYVLQNVKSVSDKDIICHQSLERAIAIDFDREKTKQKRSHRVVSEETTSHRRSAFSVRLCLREYCIEVLRSAYNTLVRQVRRVLERNSDSASHDDSYLLWAIRFFMEFNRLSGLQLHLVSESLSVQCFHWVLTRIQHDMDMITCDKKQARLWARRLHVGIQTFRELLLSLLALQKLQDEKAQALFDMLLNNICYVLEYRETVLHLLMNYNETHGTKAYLRDVIETANIFIKIMEKFCKDSVVVQEKRRQHRKGGRKSRPNSQKANKKEDENLEDVWAALAPQVSTFLVKDLNLPEEEQPIPFDAASEKSIEDQKEDCMLKIHKLLREEKIEHAIAMMRAGREVWPENDCFGAILAAPEDELMILREIFLSNLDSGRSAADEEADDADGESSEDNEEEDEPTIVEKNFRFEDFAKRLINPKVVRACTIVLSDWQSIPTKTLKSAVTILYRIAFGFQCPAMLFQATLFKIFQQVFDTPKEPHHEELRRLGVFVIRRFVENAGKNEKIYAELLLYKTLKEANDIGTGYADTEHGSIKGAWTDEQENELRILFEENQNNPQNDQDVIDWILDNLIDKTRTRRGVMKKLKEMGLVFKKATKKSLAAPSKNLWQYEEDEKLRALYDEHRLDENCLDRITEALGDSRSKNQIIKRMIQIHLIADRSEVVRKKTKAHKPRKARNAPQSEDDASSGPEMLEENAPSARKFKPKKAPKLPAKPRRDTKIRKVVRAPLDLAIVRGLISEIDENFTEAMEWLKSSLLDAAEDIEEEPSGDPDDGVPLLPLQAIQKEAMEDTKFKKLLISIGIQPPIEEMENYWRIPAYLTAADLQMRVNVISGTHEEPPLQEGAHREDDNDAGDDDETGADEQNLENNETSDEDDLHENFLSKRRERLNNLVFNKSDNEDEHRNPLEVKARKRQEETKTNRTDNSRKIPKKRGKLNIENMTKDSSDPKEEENGDEDEDEATILHIESENLRQRLAELTDSDNSEKEENDDRAKKPTHARTRTRIRPNVLESDSSADELGGTDLLTSKPDRDFQAASRSSGDQSYLVGAENATVIEAIDDQPQGSNKRARSENSHSNSDDGDESDDNVVFKRKKPNADELQKRKLVIVDDDDE